MQELVDSMVDGRVEAMDRIKGQAGAEAGMVDHVAGLIESNALRITGRLEARH